MAAKIRRCQYRYNYGESKGKYCSLPVSSGEYCKWHTGIDPGDIQELLEKKNTEKKSFEGFCLSRITLNKCRFRNAVMPYCELEETSLIDGDFDSVVMFQSNVRGANIRGINLEYANLEQSILTD
ncbi:MAG TPA: pentapeptide repeat-containing protein, partial [Planctomycetota bacterium]|nr:pentapeptide repeat-containing protein [Planctomycetota bacterium]